MVVVVVVVTMYTFCTETKKTSSFNHADHSFDELKLIITFQLLWLHSGHVVVCTAILPLP